MRVGGAVTINATAEIALTRRTLTAVWMTP